MFSITTVSRSSRCVTPSVIWGRKLAYCGNTLFSSTTLSSSVSREVRVVFSVSYIPDNMLTGHHVSPLSTRLPHAVRVVERCVYPKFRCLSSCLPMLMASEFSSPWSPHRALPSLSSFRMTTVKPEKTTNLVLSPIATEDGHRIMTLNNYLE